MNVRMLGDAYRTIDERKRFRLRKEANSAYKKNDQYQNKQSVAKFLENLLVDQKEPSKKEESFQSDDSILKEETQENRKPSFHLPIHSLPLISHITPKAATEEQSATNEEGMEHDRDSKPIQIPDRFLRPMYAQVNENPLFGKNIEQHIFQRVYQIAISKYTYQMEMAENNFYLHEPSFSQIA